MPEPSVESLGTPAISMISTGNVTLNGPHATRPSRAVSCQLCSFSSGRAARHAWISGLQRQQGFRGWNLSFHSYQGANWDFLPIIFSIHFLMWTLWSRRIFVAFRGHIGFWIISDAHSAGRGDISREKTPAGSVATLAQTPGWRYRFRQLAQSKGIRVSRAPGPPSGKVKDTTTYNQVVDGQELRIT